DSGDLKLQMIFDPTMTKKKKKKKKPFMLEEDGTEQQPEEMPTTESKETVLSESVEEKALDADDEDTKKKDTTDDLDDLDFFNQKKKKKKPKKAFDIDDGVKVSGRCVPQLHYPMQLAKLLPLFLLDDDDNKKDDGITFTSPSGPAWAGSERDYTYDELLTRVFNIMREKNPDMVAGEKRKFVMKPPQVVRVGTKKTSFVNFTDICKLLHRQPKHLLAFLLAELGTSGSIDGNSQLVIKGRFQQKQIENVLRRYIKEYVTCHTCRSPDTILQKDTRLYFLQCETCHSRCSVASIKTGFQAVTGKRAQLRAKAN
uniref:Eukaryotic translation initiation factor 2 subunit 2 n=1 Tax=Callorhinchus milii TaxID=7868 RepID=A0A4W3JU81_CALMI